MIRAVIDASIAIKWVVEEAGTAEALAIRRKFELIAPDLFVAECANVLWKKTVREELTVDEALFAARLLQLADVELLPMRPHLEDAARLAIELGHPAYDCFYIAVAISSDCQFVTADDRLVRRVAQDRGSPLQGRLLSLGDAARQ